VLTSKSEIEGDCAHNHGTVPRAPSGVCAIGVIWGGQVGRKRSGGKPVGLKVGFLKFCGGRRNMVAIGVRVGV
jgi:hypothetical protein